MPPRAMWTGQLRLSLVSFGVRLYAGTESAARVSMNQLHKDCHQRLRNQLICPVHGPVGRDEIEKGYEYEKDKYVIIDQSDLDSIKLKSSKTIELVQFVDPAEIEPIYVNAPYYLGPDGPVAEQAFRVIREAMHRSKLVGIGEVLLHGREQIVALQVSGGGFLLTTLRYASEVRQSEQVLGSIENGSIDESQVELAQSIMQSKVGQFDAAAYHDRYQEAFVQVIKAKIEGAPPILVQEDETPTAYNFLDALRESVAQSEATAPAKASSKRKKTVGKKPAAKSISPAKKKTKRSGA